MERYYVSVIDGPQYALLAGPYPTHQEALDLVEIVREKAHEVDSRSWFYAFGTCKVKDYDRPGKLNHLLPKVEDNVAS